MKIFIFILLFCINSCKDKIPPKNKRESVFSHESNLFLNKELQSIKNVYLNNTTQEYTTKYDSNSSNYIYNGNFKVLNSYSIGDGDFSYLNLDNVFLKYNDNIVILDNNGDIWLFNGKKKKKIFILKNKQNFIFANLTLYNNNIIYSGSNGYLASINLQNNKINWERQNAKYSFYAGFEIENNIGYGISKNNNLYAINLENGDEIWMNIVQSKLNIDIGSSEKLINSTRVKIYQNLVIFVSKDGNATFLNKSNGLEYFSFKLDQGINLSNTIGKTMLSFDSNLFSPAIIDNMLFIGSMNGPFGVIELNYGKMLDSKSIGVNSAIINSKNFIYFISNNSELVCIHVGSGQIKWSFKLENFYTHVLPKYLSDGKGYNKMKLNWRGPIFINDDIMLVSPFGKAILIDVNSGKITKEIKIPECVFNAPLVFNKDEIYLYSSCFNTLYLLK